MKLNLTTPDSNRTTSNGYGYAAHNILRSLVELGHDVGFEKPDADIQLMFSQPSYYRRARDQYHIGYTPWESSEVHDGWLQSFNTLDEVWTTSERCAQWYEDIGVRKPIHIYKHGIDEMWKPTLRPRRGVVKFLHVGEPSPRKGGQIAFDAFCKAFMGRRDVHLTIKAQAHNTVRLYMPNDRFIPRSIIGLPDELVNVSVITGTMSQEELLALYLDHDVLIYPSYGEGFGFIPLQALATGMPTICTSAWATYANHLGPLALNSKECGSPWPWIHPGKMFQPDAEHLLYLMEYAVQNIDELSKTYFDAASAVREEYDWTSLTREAFKHLEK